MGQYMINGEVVDIPGHRPTAADLKTAAQAIPSDWVMAVKSSGEVVQLADDDPLPADAENFTVVAPFTYGYGHN